jgi:hypothetical protein
MYFKSFTISFCFLIFLSIGILTNSSSIVYAQPDNCPPNMTCTPNNPSTSFTCPPNMTCTPNNPSANSQFQTTITQVTDTQGQIVSNQGTTTSRQLMFYLDGSTPNGVSGFECKVTSPPPYPESSWHKVNCGKNTPENPKVFLRTSSVHPGQYTLQARVIDNNNQHDPKPAVFTWTFNGADNNPGR